MDKFEEKEKTEAGSRDDGLDQGILCLDNPHIGTEAAMDVLVVNSNEDCAPTTYANKDSKLSNEVRIIDEEYQVPVQLQNYYSYNYTAYKSKEKTPSTVGLTCKECKKTIRAPVTNIDNFKRHLKVSFKYQKKQEILLDLHDWDGPSIPKIHCNFFMKCISFILQLKHDINCRTKQPEVILPSPSDQSSIIGFFKKKSEDTIDVGKQYRFDQAVCDMVCVDGLPLNFINGLGFHNLVQSCVGNVKIVCRQTIRSRIEKYNNDFTIPSLSAQYKLQPEETIHISSDIWTSVNAESVIVAKAHFIDKDWNLEAQTLGFVSFPGSHTAQNIKDKLEAMIKERNIMMHQVGALVTDNAANMAKAANLSSFFSDKWATANSAMDVEDNAFGQSELTRSQAAMWHQTSHDDLISDDEVLYVEDEILMNDDLNVDGIHSWQIGCACHSIQLAINDSIKAIEEVAALVKYLNTMIVLFRKSTKKMSDLKKICPKILLTIGTTRWNSILTAMQRFTDDAVFVKTQQLLLQYQNEDGSNVPPPTFAHRTMFKELTEILGPVKTATDKLQGNYVTSSRLIPVIEKCLIDIESLHLCQFNEFRNVLKENVMNRFRKYFQNKTFWLATFLDPRFSLSFFESDIKMLFDTPVDVIKDIVRTYVPNSETKKSNLPNSPKRPAYDDEFEYFRKNEEKKDEVGCYIDMLKQPQVTQMDPLEFWRRNCDNFPALGILARRFLAIPASSGDAERVFSISGNIKRARRAKIDIKTVENILLYREHRQPILRKKLRFGPSKPILRLET